MNDQTPNDNTQPDDEDAVDRFAPPSSDDSPTEAADNAALPDLPEAESLPEIDVDDAELDALANELNALGIGAVTQSIPLPLDEQTRFPPDNPDDDLLNLTLDTYARPQYPDEPTEIDERVANIEVDSALSAVSGLDEMVARQEAEEQVVRDEQARLSEILAKPMPSPQPLKLERGGIVSILPGLALVGVGAWLTFAYTTGNAPPTQTVSAILLGLIAFTLILGWVASGRWSRGTLFLALWGLFSAGAVVASGQLMAVSVSIGLVIAFGAAFTVGGLVSRPLSGNMILTGLMALVGGGAAVALEIGAIPTVITDAFSLRAVWIPLLVVVVVILILPLARRLRG